MNSENNNNTASPDLNAKIVPLSQPYGKGPKCDPALPPSERAYLEASIRDTLTCKYSQVEATRGTNIKFPAHLPEMGRNANLDIDISRCIASRVAIIDVSARLDTLTKFFDRTGMFIGNPLNHRQIAAFFQAFESLAISRSELDNAVQQCGSSLQELDGLLFYSGLGHFWQDIQVNAFEYAYNFSPYLSLEAVEAVTSSGMKLVGIDAQALDHPVQYFQADEAIFACNPSSQKMVMEQRKNLLFMNHKALMGRDVLVYENLNIPKYLCGRIVGFSGVPVPLAQDNCCMNALCAPYAEL